MRCLRIWENKNRSQQAKIRGGNTLRRRKKRHKIYIRFVRKDNSQ